MMVGPHSVPFMAMLAIVTATLLRGVAVRRTSGDRPWAFASAKGVQRIAGTSFALSVASLLVAAALAPAKVVTISTVSAALLALIGATIVIVAQVQMGRAWRVGVREGDAPLFVSRGLFRFSRNPIFVGMMLVGLATAMAFGAGWSWAAFALFVLSCTVQVRIEETHLEASFGDSYRAFCNQVPRWLGIARPA
jgi:protein-S-isoprenylcysteine O-methyltransferase Ste14